jgi:predicted permease
MTVTLWRNPKVYGLLGFILVSAPSLFFFFMGVLGTSVMEKEYAGGNRTVVTETVWMDAFNPFLLIFVIGAAVAAWGCYRNKNMALVGSIFVLAYSILAMFSIGMLILPGAVVLLVGAVVKTFDKSI